MRTRKTLLLLTAVGLATLQGSAMGAIYQDDGQAPLPSRTRSQVQSAGFSSRMLSSLNATNRYDTPRQATVEPRLAADALPPIQVPPDAGSGGSSALPALPPISVGGDGSGSSSDSGSIAAPPPLDAIDAGSGSGSASGKPPKSGKGSKGTGGKSSKSGKSSGRSSGSSRGNNTVLSSGQEVYSQEPLRLPPISAIPEQPARTTLPPLQTNRMLEVPLVQADSIIRVLACNSNGFTGLSQTTSADISKEGSFKMGVHSSWFKLERVYDRVLATNESGDLLQMPLFFNYAVTNDLEVAFMMPILNYTVKSRILWSKDFRESGVGDSKLGFKYRVFDNPEYQMRGAFGLSFKFPTGSDAKGLGTGKTDFEIFTSFSKTFEKVIAHLNLGYVMTGDPNNNFYPDGLADIFYYNIGLEYPHTHNVTVMAEVNGTDWGAEGLSVDVTPGLRYTPTENFAFEVSIPVSVTNDQRFGYNYRLNLGLTSFFK